MTDIAVPRRDWDRLNTDLEATQETIVQLRAKLAEAEMHLAADRKRANEAARLSAAARDEADDLRAQIGELQEHIGIVEGDRLVLQEQRHFVLLLCDDAEQVVGRTGFVRVNAIREALDRPAGGSTVFLRDNALSDCWSLAERDIIEAARGYAAAWDASTVRPHLSDDDTQAKGQQLARARNRLIGAVDVMGGDGPSNVAATAAGTLCGQCDEIPGYCTSSSGCLGRDILGTVGRVPETGDDRD